jgi:antitoxin component YwqK of YwqJK toxin-antitoxin module
MLKSIYILSFLIFFQTKEKIYVKNYFSNKQLKEEGWKLNDKKTDYWFYYFENGTKKAEGHYKNNQKTNWWIFYDSKGLILKKSEFKNDKPDGLTLIYNDGNIIRGEKYKSGKKIKQWNSVSEFKKDNSSSQ